MVDAGSLNTDRLEVTHINVNDGTLEGFGHRHLPVFGVQFHPEAAPGPQDTQHLFDEFIAVMENTGGRNSTTMPKRKDVKRVW